MSTRSSRFILAALTAATMALPLAVAGTSPAFAACAPNSSMSKCAGKCAGKCGGKCAGKCAGMSRHGHHKKMSKCAGKCGPKKCAPKCRPK